jgi:hypothetical protein
VSVFKNSKIGHMVCRSKSSPMWDEMLRDKNAKKSERVMKAILQMTKPDIKTLKQAMNNHNSLPSREQSWERWVRLR